MCPEEVGSLKGGPQRPISPTHFRERVQKTGNLLSHSTATGYNNATLMTKANNTEMEPSVSGSDSDARSANKRLSESEDGGSTPKTTRQPSKHVVGKSKQVPRLLHP